MDKIINLDDDAEFHQPWLDPPLFSSLTEATWFKSCKKRQTDRCPFLCYSRTRILPAVTSAAPVSSTSSTTVTPFHRLGFVNHQATPIQLRAVKGLDCPLGLSPGTHLHESETP